MQADTRAVLVSLAALSPLPIGFWLEPWFPLGSPAWLVLALVLWLPLIISSLWTRKTRAPAAAAILDYRGQPRIQRASTRWPGMWALAICIAIVLLIAYGDRVSPGARTTANSPLQAAIRLEVASAVPDFEQRVIFVSVRNFGTGVLREGRVFFWPIGEDGPPIIARTINELAPGEAQELYFSWWYEGRSGKLHALNVLPEGSEHFHFLMFACQAGDITDVFTVAYMFSCSPQKLECRQRPIVESDYRKRPGVPERCLDHTRDIVLMLPYEHRVRAAQ